MLWMKTCRIGVIEMSSREDFKAWAPKEGFDVSEYPGLGVFVEPTTQHAWIAWQASREQESDLLAALKAITNSGPDAIPIKEAFEMAHRAIERAMGDKV